MQWWKTYLDPLQVKILHSKSCLGKSTKLLERDISIYCPRRRFIITVQHRKIQISIQSHYQLKLLKLSKVKLLVLQNNGSYRSGPWKGSQAKSKGFMRWLMRKNRQKKALLHTFVFSDFSLIVAYFSNIGYFYLFRPWKVI